MNKTTSNISWSIAEKVMTEIVNTTITLILARILDPSDYGLVSLVSIFITVSSIFVSDGLRYSVIAKKDINEKEISTIFYVNLLLGLILYFFLFIFAPVIASFRGNYNLIPIIRVLSLKLPIQSVYSILHGYIQRKMEFKRFFFSSLLGTIVSGIIGIVMAINGYGVWAIVASTLADQTIDCIFLFFNINWFPKFCFDIYSVKDSIIYGFDILTSELLGRAYTQARPLLIGLKYKDSDLAYNDKANKISSSLVNAIDTSIQKVILPKLSCHQSDIDKSREVVRNYIELSSFILFPMMFGLFSISNNLIPFLFTEKWINCVPYLKIYCLIYCTVPISSINTMIAQANGLGKELIKYKIVLIFTEISITVAAIILFDTPLSLCLGMLVSSLIYTMLVAKVANNVLNLSLLDQLSFSFSSFLISIVMSFIVTKINIINFNHFSLIIIQIICGIVLYFLLSFTFKTKAMTSAISFIKSFIKK